MAELEEVKGSYVNWGHEVVRLLSSEYGGGDRR
jgi:hypothetical protein